MSASSGKVITSLLDRIEIERQLNEMLEVRSEEELYSRARRVAASGAQVVPLILGNLDRASPQTLNALGVVASLYPHRDEILEKLYQVAADVERQDRERVSAVLLLERFLDQEPDSYLIETLHDPRAVAIESIKDVIRASEQDPAVLLEYTRTLAAQPVETVFGVIDTLLEVCQERAVPVLCLMAQEDGEVLSTAALSVLGQIRHPDAARGLQSLIPMLPPDRRPVGERSLRKLQFSGLPVSPLSPADAAWRALVSPIDGQGNRVVWFIQERDKGDGYCSLGMSLNDSEGIAQTHGNYSAPAEALPSRHGVGYVHRVPMRAAYAPSSQPSRERAPILHLLETDLEYGRRLVREAQTLHFELGRSLPVEYRLLGPLLWQYDATQADANRRRPPTTAYALDVLPETASLLLHPFFKGWFAYSERMLEHATATIKWKPIIDRRGMHNWATELANEYFDEATLKRLRARLEAMEEWLLRAGETRLAELAMVTATTITEVPATKHPFTLRMSELGLTMIFYQLHEQLNSSQ